MDLRYKRHRCRLKTNRNNSFAKTQASHIIFGKLYTAATVPGKTIHLYTTLAYAQLLPMHNSCPTVAKLHFGITLMVWYIRHPAFVTA